jgi:hypothetical protein
MFRMELLLVAKDVEQPAAIEDSGGFDEEIGVAVIVDGAAGGYDSRGWSRCLARSTLIVARSDPNAKLLTPLVWEHALRAYSPSVTRAPTPGIPLKHSGATLGILRTQTAQDGLRWMVEVIGDINVALVRPNGFAALLEDLATPEDYGRRPQLVTSESSRTTLKTQLRYTQPSVADPGDTILLFSDGLGPWLTRNASAELLQTLESVDSDEFGELIATERSVGRLVPVDDIMMIRCLISD